MNHPLSLPDLVKSRFGLVLAGFLLVATASAQLSACSAAPDLPANADQTQTGVQDQDMVATLGRVLNLTDAQKSNIDGIVKRHEDQIAAMRVDYSLTPKQQQGNIHANRLEMVKEITPFLQSDQVKRLDRWLKEVDSASPQKKQPFIPLLSITVGEYLPTDSLSRQIFGSSTSFFGIGFRDFARSPSSNDLVGFSFNTLRVGGSSDKFFVISPQITYEHRFPISEGFSAYGKLLGGPAYMDYSFDLPNGDHFGAKRFGAEGELEVGLRYGRFQLCAQYHVLTEPQDVSFNGMELSLTWIAVRF